MKRIHLFEFEDQPWFPNSIRMCMTRMIVVMHKLLGTNQELAKILDKALTESGENQITDMCSGSGGPMPETLEILRKEYGHKDLKLVLSDLYPNVEMAERINNQQDSNISYYTKPLDATKVDPAQKGVRTMICSMHHMRPEVAKAILKNAKEDQKPICIFEISDNSFPIILNFISLPINFVMALVVSLFARPMTWQQLVFTYLIPVIPICYAWDGSISNARTYTLKDMDELLEGLHSEHYRWEKGVIKGKGNKLFLLGLPVK